MSLTRRQIIQGTAAAAASLSVPALTRAQGQPIRVGLLASTSGAYATVGESYTRGFKIAIEDANKAGGLLGRQVEGIERNDKFSGAGAIAAVRELASLGANLVVSGGGSVSTLGAAPLLKELNMVFVNGGAAAMPIRHESFVRNMFSTVANAYVQYGGLGRAMAEQYPTLTKWAVIIPDSTFGRDSYKVWSGMMRKYHPKGNAVRIGEAMVVNQSAADFRQQINTLMNSDVEGVYMGVVGGATVSFFQQAHSVGLDKKLKAMCEGSGDLTAKALGRDMPPAFWGPIFWNPTAAEAQRNKGMRDFVAALKAMGQEHPDSVAELGHRAALGLFAGIRKAGSTDTEAVIKAMEGLSFDTVLGPYRFRERDHQAVGTTGFAQFTASDKPPYFDVKTFKAVSDEIVIESPSPGSQYII